MRISFELYKCSLEEIPTRYQEVSCHIIFDVKMGKNFLRKSRMVAGGHNNTAPSSLTYLSVVSWDILRISFKNSALNDLKVLL